jgi:hypothetical protein
MAMFIGPVTAAENEPFYDNSNFWDNPENYNDEMPPCGYNISWDECRKISEAAAKTLEAEVLTSPTPKTPSSSSSKPKVDVIFVVDTSGSMADEASVLCTKMSGIASTLQINHKVDLIYKIWGILQGGYSGWIYGTCIDRYGTDFVDSQLSNSIINHDEDWGAGTTVVANQYPWRYGAVRVIIPVSDEGPENGNGCYDPGSDRDAITAAITAAQNNNVIVFPIMASGQTSCGINLGNDLALGTGGEMFYSTNPSSDMADKIAELILKSAINEPDFLINPSDISFSAVDSNNQVKITVTVHNDGTKSASNVPVRFWYQKPGSNYVRISTKTIPSIPSKGSATTSTYWTPSEGKSTIIVKADPDFAISEWDETNNIAKKMYSLTKKIYISSMGSSEDLIKDYMVTQLQNKGFKITSSISEASIVIVLGGPSVNTYTYNLNKHVTLPVKTNSQKKWGFSNQKIWVLGNSKTETYAGVVGTVPKSEIVHDWPSASSTYKNRDFILIYGKEFEGTLSAAKFFIEKPEQFINDIRVDNQKYAGDYNGKVIKFYLKSKNEPPFTKSTVEKVLRQEKFYSIYGIISSSDGSPLENLKVELYQSGSRVDAATTFTDEKGVYLIPLLLDDIADGLITTVKASLVYSHSRDLRDTQFKVYSDSEWGPLPWKLWGAKPYSKEIFSGIINKNQNKVKSVSFSRAEGGPVYATLTKSYKYFKEKNLAPNVLVETEIGNDDILGGGTSYQNGNSLHISHKQTNNNGLKHTVAHEYSHFISEQWGCLPYGPDNHHQVCGDSDRKPTFEESLDENWANYGAILVLDTKYFWAPLAKGGETEIDISDNTQTQNRWNYAMVGAWYDLKNVLGYNEERTIDTLRRLSKEKYYPNRTGEGGKQNVKGFYEIYTEGFSTRDKCAIKNLIFGMQGQGYDTTTWEPIHCTGNQSIFSGYHDTALDINNDGKYENLVIDVSVDISEEGIYSLYGYLKESRYSTGYVLAYDRTKLYPGLNNISLRFDGLAIYNQRLEGQLNLLDLEIYSENGTSLQYLANPYNTSWYSYTQFQKPAVTFNGTFNDHAYDTDSDGRFDILSINVGLDVATAGNYSVSGTLYSGSGKVIDSAITPASLNVGSQSISLDFNGDYLFRTTENGPYTLKNLYVFKGKDLGGGGGSVQIIHRNLTIQYNTSAYNYLGFQVPSANITNIVDRATDTDGNGKYDYLTVEVTINVTENSNYSLSADLFVNETISSTSNSTPLSQGIRTLELNYKAKDIIENQFTNGTIKKLSLYDHEGNLVDWWCEECGSYNTNLYDPTTFEIYTTEIGSKIKDYGLDTNGNSLYDYLVIEVGILVNESGNYSLFGYLNNTEQIMVTYNVSNLSAGYHTVSLMFEKDAITKSGKYSLENLVLFKYEGLNPPEIIDEISDAYTTSTYTTSDFEQSIIELLGVNSDSGIDSDSNGLYDSLQVNISLNVSARGNYTVYSILTKDGNLISDSEVEAALSEGVQYLNLEFDAEEIVGNEENGPFTLSLVEIYDNNSVFITSSVPGYSTASYSLTSFDRKTSYFTGTYSEEVHDTNSNNLYESLEITAETNVQEEGEYLVEVSLSSPGNEFVVSGSTYSYLSSGIQNISIVIPGVDIYNRSINGSYIIDFIKLTKNGTVHDYRENPFNTSAYNYTQFEHTIYTDVDLVIENTDISATNTKVGEAVRLNATVHNRGNSSAISIIVEVYVGNPDVNGTLIGAQTITMISGGANSTVQITPSNKYDLTWILSEGTRDIYVKVDPYNAVNETNESNNNANTQIFLSANTPPVLSNPSVTPSSGSWMDYYKYSLNISDAEGDNVSLILQIYKDGTWHNATTEVIQDTKTEKTVYLNHKAFTSNDRNTVSKYRIYYSDEVSTDSYYSGEINSGYYPSVSGFTGPIIDDTNYGGLSLSQGWNMFSLPVFPSSNLLPNVLSSIGSSYEIVYYYNTSSGIWDYYDKTIFSTLDRLSPYRGYYIKMASADTISFMGELVLANDTSIDLKSGWNMVSVPLAMEDYSLPAVISDLSGDFDMVLYYNHTKKGWDYFAPEIPEYSSLKKLEPGKGYFLHMKGDRTWGVS